MSKKKGVIENSLSVITGLVIMILLLMSCSLVTRNIAEQDPDVRVSITYNKFLDAYAACAAQTKDKCICDELDFTLLAKEEFIHLTQQQDGVAISLERYGETTPLKTTFEQGKKLCTYDFFTDSKQFMKNPIPEQTVALATRTRFPEETPFLREQHLALYKEGDFLCFVNYLSVPLGAETWSFSHKLIDPSQPHRIPPIDKEIDRLQLRCSAEQPSTTSPIDNSTLFTP